MAEYTKRSFTGGVIAPALRSRADLEKYQTSLAECENFYVLPEGGAENRSGFKFVQEIANSTKVARLIPFEFNVEQTYMLEFADFTMRVIKDGAYVVEDTVSITNITQANPAVVTAASHGYSNGDKVFIDNVGGMTEVNGRFFTVSGVATNTFQLIDLFGNNVNSTSFTAYTSGGTVARVFTLTTPYAAGDLAALDYFQSNDVMTLTHEDYKQRELSRTDHDAWTLTTINYNPNVSVPTNLAVTTTGTSSGADNKTYEYVVTAIKDGQESLPVEVYNTTTFDADGFPVTYESTTITMAAQSVTWGAEITWTAPSEGADSYNIYKAESHGSGIFGWIGESKERVFRDFNIAPLMSIGPPGQRNPFNWAILDLISITGTFQEGELITDQTSGATGVIELIENSQSVLTISRINGTFGTSNQVVGQNSTAEGTITDIRERFYPSTGGYYQQRILFAGSKAEPQTAYTSRSGDYKDFRTSTPTQDDDAVTFTIASQQVNKIRHIVDVGQLLFLTSGGIWKITEGEDQVLTPSTVGARRQSKFGSSDIKPIVIGGSVLYIEDQQTRVRDMSLTLGVTEAEDRYTGTDLSILAQHLFRGFTVDAWDYAREPAGIIWAVRSDGVLLGLTYHRAHNVWGWHSHSLGASSAGDAVVEEVSTVREGSVNAVYIIVKRTINGSTKRYVERLHSREFSTAEDCFFVDSGLTYDGAETSTISGLYHLEGETLVGLADGNVVTDLTVSGGEVTLPNAASKVHLGLAYTGDLETLDVDFTDSVLIGKKKHIGNVAIQFLNSRGGYVGPDSSTLTEIKWREVDDSYDAIGLHTGVQEVLSGPKATDGGRVHIRQSDPLPMGVLAIVPDVRVGG